MIFSSWLLYAEISAWHIKLNTMKFRAGKIAFFLVLYCNTAVLQIPISQAEFNLEAGY